jgi:hypothetical protein
MVSPTPENHFQVRVMMLPALRNEFLGAGDGITRFWKWSRAKNS